MKFALFCQNCRSWETNIHFDIVSGFYIMHCLDCRNEEKIFTSQSKKPVSKKELKKMREIDEAVRRRAVKKVRLKN